MINVVVNTCCWKKAEAEFRVLAGAAALVEKTAFIIQDVFGAQLNTFSL